jgi:sugar phosphate isomerase/epimerase
MSTHPNNYPKLHNAMWPGLVGKGSPGAEPFLSLDTMLDLTAKAEVDGIKFEGVDIFLYEPHINIDITNDDLKSIADKILSRGLVVGSVVAPVWPPTGGGSAMGSVEDRKKFVEQVRKACRIGSTLRALGARPHGVVRIDSASSVEAWSTAPDTHSKLIAQTFSEACDVAEGFGERLAAEGEICWGGMHSWREMVKLLELVGRPKTLGFQADMAHTLLYTLGYNAPGDSLVPADYDWKSEAVLQEALAQLTSALRPWTIDFHVAQNDATVKGSGSHDKTGHHCLATDPNGKLDIVHDAGYWLRDEKGQVTRAFRHLCWDGCMFPNEVMMKPRTWNDILAVMINVRDAHGWREVEAHKAAAPKPAVAVVATPPPSPKAAPAPPAKVVAALAPKLPPIPAKAKKAVVKPREVLKRSPARKPARKPVRMTHKAAVKQSARTPVRKPVAKRRGGATRRR